MVGKKMLAILIVVFFLAGCDSFRVAGQFAAGRRAFVAKNYEEALTYLNPTAVRKFNSSTTGGILPRFGNSRNVAGGKRPERPDPARRERTKGSVKTCV
ncbi:MAG: hypothetical protein ACREQ2_16640 [Candidatus Binatia bacterium]